MREMLNEALYTGTLRDHPPAKEALPGTGGKPAHARSRRRPPDNCAAPAETMRLHAPTPQHPAVGVPGRQGTELILLYSLRNFWIIKLDLQKAFDSVAQTSLADVVERRMGADHM